MFGLRATFGIGCLIVWFFPATTSAEETVVYKSTFDDFVQTSYWSHTVTGVVGGGSRVFLGPFGKNDAPMLRVKELPEHKMVRVKVRLVLLEELDGNSGSHGPDLWAIAVDGRRIFKTTFVNHPKHGDGSPRFQAFPDEHPAGNNRGTSGASEVHALGFKGVPLESRGGREHNTVYDLEFVVAHLGSDLDVQLGSQFSEPIFDESWGMESVEVSILTEPETLEPEEMVKLWGDISGLSAIKAHAAVWKLAACGKAGADFLTAQVEESGVPEGDLPPQIEARIKLVRKVVAPPDSKSRVRASSSTPFFPASNAHDGRSAANSSDLSPEPFVWEGKGDVEYLELHLDAPQKIGNGKVFWHVGEDGAEPASWHIEYLDAAGEWMPVEGATDYAVLVDWWCSVEFDEVESRGFRLVAQLAWGKQAGVSEFEISPAAEKEAEKAEAGDEAEKELEETEPKEATNEEQ